MNNSNAASQYQTLARKIVDFVESSEGLKILATGMTDYLGIEQVSDGRSIQFNIFDLDEVILRVDEDDKDFLQINFLSGKKVLLTDQLVGFRPMALFGLDMEKLPKVVTTPDISSIFEAIQESLQGEESTEELDVLRKVYDSVLCGGESIGFDLSKERELFARIPLQHLKAAA